MAFDVGWTSVTFNAGHRIRVAVASTGAPLYEPNQHQDGSPMGVESVGKAGGPVVTNAVLDGGGHASRIIAPVVPLRA